jgi:ribonuclease VapC
VTDGRVVLDASALLAILNRESGADEVAAHLPRALVSTVNLSEVVAVLVTHGMPGAAVHRAIDGLALTVVDFDAEQAYAAGFLRVATRASGLSLGDRACLSLAAQLEIPVLTADRCWTELDLGLDVHLIR